MQYSGVVDNHAIASHLRDLDCSGREDVRVRRTLDCAAFMAREVPVGLVSQWETPGAAGRPVAPLSTHITTSARHPFPALLPVNPYT